MNIPSLGVLRRLVQTFKTRVDQTISANLAKNIHTFLLWIVSLRKVPNAWTACETGKTSRNGLSSISSPSTRFKMLFENSESLAVDVSCNH